MMFCVYLQGLTRRKRNIEDGSESKLARVLNLFDLTFLGVGTTLGLGVYVLAGSVAKTTAGPAVCISFLIAAIASAVAGLCYAEFAARVPKAGSAYIYSYVTVGEFVAFVIGWNLLLEYGIGTASTAKGLTNYIDSLFDKQIQKTLTELMPINVSFLSPYPDFLALTFVLIMTGILAAGARESSTLNNLFTGLNIATILVVVVAGSIKADTDNWKIDVNSIQKKEDRDIAGEGGFLPFGFTGIMAGAATCFYGFVGFDTIASTGEEAKYPQRDIPLAILISLSIIFAAYFSISTVITMAWPYYLQDSEAPFPYLFDQLGWPVIKWIVTCGAIFALCTSLIGAIFPLPRIVYSMASDGIIFKFLAKVNPKTKTPLIATIVSGVLAGVMTLIFDLDQLIDMMSIGTLLAYTIVSISVLILRYAADESTFCGEFEMQQKDDSIETSMCNGLKLIFNLNNKKTPSPRTAFVVNWSIVLFSIFTALFCATLTNAREKIFTEAYFMIAAIISSLSMLILLTVIGRQPKCDPNLSFKVPCVPLIPSLSIFFNIYLMMELDSYTWIRFIAWMIIGFIVYFGYGVSHSTENPKNRKTASGGLANKEVTKL